jgi:hypothetical protein
MRTDDAYNFKTILTHQRKVIIVGGGLLVLKWRISGEVNIEVTTYTYRD